jgi:hypothetical protein
VVEQEGGGWRWYSPTFRNYGGTAPDVKTAKECAIKQLLARLDNKMVVWPAFFKLLREITKTTAT